MLRVALVATLLLTLSSVVAAQPKKNDTPDKSAEQKIADTRTQAEKDRDREQAAATATTIMGVGLTVFIVGAVFSLLVYCAPTAIAIMRGHANLGPILIVNVFLGWTFIGWIVALAWAFSSQNAPRYRRGY